MCYITGFIWGFGVFFLFFKINRKNKRDKLQRHIKATEADHFNDYRRQLYNCVYECSSKVVVFL